MSLKSLFRNVLENDSVPLKVLVVATSVTALTGLVYDLIGAPVAQAALVAFAAGLFAFVYSMNTFRSKDRVDSLIAWAKSAGVKLRAPIYAIPAFLVALLLISASIPPVQAAIFNHRLESYLMNSASENTDEKIVQVLGSARALDVKLKPRLVSTVASGSAAREPGEKWDAYVAAVNYRLGTSSSPDSAPPSFELGHFSSLKNDKFSSMRIAYHGGPVTLEAVIFDRCTFIVDQTENGRLFLAAVQAANGGPVSITLE